MVGAKLTIYRTHSLHQAAMSELTIIGATIAILGAILMFFDIIRRAWIRAFGSHADYVWYLSQSHSMRNDKKKLIRDIIGLVLTVVGIALFAYELGILSG